MVTDTERAISQARGKLESIKQMVAKLHSDNYSDREDAEDDIREHPLSVEVRSGWVFADQTLEPGEYCILLSTGRPAVRIVGDLDRYDPFTAWLEYQDWGLPWTTYLATDEEGDTLLEYARQFYFGA